jgi:hypothetical protein
MFGSDVMEIILGLGVAVIALGIVCAAASEFIEMLLNTRGRDLLRGIIELTNEPQICYDVYKHPLIASLYRGEFHPTQPNNLPSYIPPRLFALALLDLVTVHSEVDSLARSFAPSYPSDFNRLSPSAVQEAAEKRLPPDSSIRRSLRMLIAAAGDDSNRLLASIEAWFAAVMREVTNWSLRRRKLMLLVLGLLICASFNVDPLNLANYFATARAQSTFWLQNSKPDNSVANSYASTADALRQIRSLGLPVGWGGSDPVRIPSTADGWLLKIGGFVLMSFAICACGVASLQIAKHLGTAALSRTRLTQTFVKDPEIARARGESSA